MPKIFICYRREDSAYPAHQIYRDLVDHFGSESVVFDVDTIPIGTDFRDYLNKEVCKCDILLAVIGDQWIELLNERLNEPNDFIRIEIMAALERKIPVVPVLVGKASVPCEKDLPNGLEELAYKQVAEVRAGSDYLAHINRLIEGLDYLLVGHVPDNDIKKKHEKKRVIVTKTFKNTIGMKFVLIPVGSFVMGSHSEFKLKNFLLHGDVADQSPAHEVKISQPFYLQITQVTQGHWKKVMGDNPSKFKGCGEDCPVEKVSWYETQKFISTLNQMENTNSYRLPTEAEWEYACRAGTTSVFSYGDDEEKLDEYAWYKKNSGKRTHPIGSKKPNAWGLYDMHGNVGEWVEDDYHFNYNEAPSDGSAWYLKSNGTLSSLRKSMGGKVFRGGSWINKAMECGSAARLCGSPDFHINTVGLRLATSGSL